MLTNPPRNRRWYSLLLCLLAAAGLAARPARAAESERPNILFIYTDDHSYRTVGAYPKPIPGSGLRPSTAWHERECGSSRRISEPGACPRGPRC